MRTTGEAGGSLGISLNSREGCGVGRGSGESRSSGFFRQQIPADEPLARAVTLLCYLRHPRPVTIPLWVSLRQLGRHTLARSRSVGASRWTTVLSELAGVPVVVEWESPSWRVRWVDGPTRVQLLDRATALDRYGIGAPLSVAQMRFSRRVSTVATAVGWLAHGSQGGMAAEYDVDLWCADTAYPQQQAGPELLAAAVVLAAVSQGDTAVLAALMTSAWPPLEPAALPGPVTDELPGRVVSFAWPGRGGPPAHLLQPAETPAAPEPAAALTQPPAPTTVGACGRCGDPLPARSAARGGRPAQYCSDRCRVAAHRARIGQSATSAVT